MIRIPPKMPSACLVKQGMNLCIYSLIDIGIHYRGWDAARTAVFLKAFGINNASTAAEIYQYIVETPR